MLLLSKIGIVYVTGFFWDLKLNIVAPIANEMIFLIAFNSMCQRPLEGVSITKKEVGLQLDLSKD